MGRERNDAPGPFNFRGCDLTAEWLPATEHVRVQLPAAAPFHFRLMIYDCRFASRCAQSNRLRVSTRPSLQNSAHSGQHGGSLPIRKSKIVNHKFIVGPWLKSEAPALQAVPSGSVTRRTPPILITVFRSAMVPFAILDRSQDLPRHVHAEFTHEQNAFAVHSMPSTVA